MSKQTLLGLAGALAFALTSHAQQTLLRTNLIEDSAFNSSRSNTPWVAASGSRDNMLCYTSDCSKCFTRNGSRALRFEARDTDDVWAIQQPVFLPVADRYEFTMYLAGCNGAPQGSVSISLDGVGTHDVPLLPEDETGGYRRITLIFEAPIGDGETGGTPMDSVLTIGNPSLQGADVMIDDVRLVERFSDDGCPGDAALLGDWHRLACDGKAGNDWTFNDDGTFSVVNHNYADTTESLHEFGVYCVNTLVTPAQITMVLDRSCDPYEEPRAPEEGQACEHEGGETCLLRSCSNPGLVLYGVYAIEGDALSMRVQDCPVDTLDQALSYGRAVPSEPQQGPCLAYYECADFAHPLLGNWGRGICGPTEDPRNHHWLFMVEDRYIEYFTMANGDYFEYWGTYEEDEPGVGTLETLGYRIDHAGVDGVGNCYTGEDGQPHCFDWVRGGDFYTYMRYEISGDSLLIADGDCRPSDTSGAFEHSRNGEFCVAAEDYGFDAPPEQCGEECADEDLVLDLMQGRWNAAVCAADGVAPRTLLWNFRRNGEFAMVYSEGVPGSEEFTSEAFGGHFTIDISTQPYSIDLRLNNVCETAGAVDAGGEDLCIDFRNLCGFDSCTRPDRFLVGVFGIQDNRLLISIGDECRPADLEGANALVIGAPGCMEPMAIHPPGDAPVCPPDSSVDASLWGHWTGAWNTCTDSDQYHGWEFFPDGTFAESFSESLEGDYYEYYGTYTVDTSTTPHTIDLHYETIGISDDMMDSDFEGECIDPPGGVNECWVDFHAPLDITVYGVYAATDADLSIRLGECRPENLDGAAQYLINYPNCTATANFTLPAIYPYPQFDLPGCTEEGEGPTEEGEAEEGEAGPDEGECKEEPLDFAAIVAEKAGVDGVVMVNGDAHVPAGVLEKGDCPPAEEDSIFGVWRNGTHTLDIRNGEAWEMESDLFVSGGCYISYNYKKGYLSVDTSVCPNELTYLWREQCWDCEETSCCDDFKTTDKCSVDCSRIYETSTVQVYMVDAVLYVVGGAAGDRYTRSGDCIPEGPAPAVACEGQTGPAPNELLWGNWEATSCGSGFYTSADWQFRPNGTFFVEQNRRWDPPQIRTSGTYQVDATQTPVAVTLHYTERCDLNVSNGCTSIDETSHGELEITAGGMVMTLNPHGCLSEGYELRWACSDYYTCTYGEGEFAECLPPDWAVPHTCDVDGEAESDTPAGLAMESFNTADTNGDDQLSESEAGNMGISAEDFAVLDANGNGEVTAAELFLAAGVGAPAHNMDTSLDHVISLSELLRVIQLYNAGAYGCAPLAESEDGYVPEDNASGLDSACPPHASDYAPADGVLSLSEMLRAIQLYNSGGYVRCAEGGEDGYCLE